MLTRDIDLADAILDLLDNCIDGVVRQTARDKKKSKKPYDGYWAEINLTPERFEILDNCGGIPRDIAKKSAFMLGRPDLERDKDVETVGMYGIGMKRAIFKMGRDCVVTSMPNGHAYQVAIPPSWFKKDNDWELKLKSVSNGLDESGTRLVVTALLDPIKRAFDKQQSGFIKTLKTEISELYALIIGKGFTVKVNGETITPIELSLLAPSTIPKAKRKAIVPYAFRGTVEGVNVRLSVGFHRALLTEQELASETEGARGRTEAGWTVICNDRIVLHADTSKITGWGTATVPAYHNQFRAIAGIVSFRSTDSFALPIDTTKRRIDMSSSVYLYVLDIMREGVKKFTDFTNKWKTREIETYDEFSGLELRPQNELLESIPHDQWITVRRGANVSAKKFIPDLPMPVSKNPMRRISFSRRQSEIELVAEHLFGDEAVSPSEVGEQCFKDVLDEAKK